MTTGNFSGSMPGVVPSGFVSRSVYLPPDLYHRARIAASAAGWSYARWGGILLQDAATRSEDEALADRLDGGAPRGICKGMIKTQVFLRKEDHDTLQRAAQRLGCRLDALMREILKEFLGQHPDGGVIERLRALERSRIPVRENSPWL